MRGRPLSNRRHLKNFSHKEHKGRKGEADHAPSPLQQEQNGVCYQRFAGGLEQSAKAKKRPTGFPANDACASEPVDQFFSCQVLQLLTLEAASLKNVAGVTR